MIRPGRGLYGYERALTRAGFSPIAGADEAGRGACAGPLVAAAVVLADTPARQITGLRDSKLLTPKARERCFDEIMAKAVAVSCVSIEADECDRLGMHVADIQALRRAVSRLEVTPEFVLTDGFPVDGLGVPGLAVWKGDRVAACVAAASVIAKVTRDRIMTDIAAHYPQYRFDVHKGYCTPEHQAELDRFGPADIHRRRFELVRRAATVKAP
ncbi:MULTISPECIES: ribonuclease HII [Aestuariimicrobium]|uniref:ribonuclease HII n=1 Tax=Aestuariimicrobium TaxID=396388 RepID=UPI0003B576F4|nr:MULTISPECIES: ribonuclease HII [Aestuariimicrobium]CAI9398670.1 Ribonuclease HII [Aestuariimicrobium sp. T2.26MG-19.2B]